MLQDPPTILSVTSTLPRWPGDTEPRFVLDLNRLLGDRFRLITLAPHVRGAARAETLEGVEVRRYRYFWARGETLAYDGGLMARLRARPLRWLLVPFLFVAQVAAIFRVLRAQPVAVIHAHWLVPQALCALIARGLAARRPPVVCTVHGSDLFALNHAILRRLQRSLANRCALVAAVSDAVRSELIARGVDERRIRVMPMGVSVTGAGSASMAPAHIVFVGRLVEKKGLDVLLRAFREVAGRHPQARLTVAGGGPERARYEALAAPSETRGRVAFTGPLAHHAVLQLYRDATVTVVPSVGTEGLGLVALEAMAAGCPVVASDLPAIRTFIRHGDTGLLFPVGDHAALARALEQLLGDAGLRARLGVAARERAQREFGWPVAAARYRDALAELAARDLFEVAP